MIVVIVVVIMQLRMTVVYVMEVMQIKMNVVCALEVDMQMSVVYVMMIF